MKFDANDLKITALPTGNFLYLKLTNEQIDPINKIINHKNDTSIEIKVKREKRSLSANAYCHTLIEKIAKLLTSTHDEIYEQMLHDYGVHKFPVCTPKKISGYKQDYKFVEVMNKLKVQLENGKLVDAVQLKCTTGSSKYDSLQMSQFIEGIKIECDTLGIETKSPQEIANLIKMIGEE